MVTLNAETTPFTCITMMVDRKHSITITYKFFKSMYRTQNNWWKDVGHLNLFK